MEIWSSQSFQGNSLVVIFLYDFFILTKMKINKRRKKEKKDKEVKEKKVTFF